MSESDEALQREVKALRAQVGEAEVLVRFLRERTVVLNNEIRHRDGLLVQRDQTIADLSSNAEAPKAP